MRKWMRERLKRREKPEKIKSSEPAPAPLQPAYFEADAASRVEPEPAVEAEAREAVEAPDAAAAPGPEPSSGGAVPVQPARRRRRRSRSGRGRGAATAATPGAGALPTAAASIGETSPPAIAEASQPSMPVEQIPVAPAPSRPPKGTVILAIGLPGSGKSSWFKRKNITPLSSDMLRLLLFDDPQEQRFQDLVFSNLRSMLKARLIARRPLNFLDATNLTPHERHSWIKLAKDYGYDVQAVFFDVPLEVCLERNRRRERMVDEDVMRRMSAKLRVPTFEEGFSKVTVVRVKKKEDPEAAG